MVLLSTYSAVPLLSLAAAALCPNTTRVARCLAASLGCLLGTAVGTYLENAKRDAAYSSVLHLLAEGFAVETEGEDLRQLVATTRRRFGVPRGSHRGEGFEDAELGSVYEQVLKQLLQGQEHDAGDLPALLRLKAALDLDGIVVGLAHKRAAQVLEGEAMPGVVDKLLFLSERAFADEEPEEARVYEMSRVRKLLKISEKEAHERISAVSKALYRQNLSAVVDQVDAHTGEALAGASAAFGLGGEEVARMNAETYRQIAMNLTSGGRLTDQGKKTLVRAQLVLQLGDRAAASAFADVASPLLRTTVDRVSERLRDEASVAPEQLKQLALDLAGRRDELGLPAETAEGVVREGFLAMLRSLYDKACKDVRVKGDEPALVTLGTMLTFARKASEVLAQLHALQAPGASAPDSVALTLPADSTAARRLYGLYFVRHTQAAPPEDLAQLLELSETDEEVARVEVCQPLLRDMFENSIEKAANGGPPLSLAKMAVGAEMAKFRLPSEVVKEAAVEVYKIRLAPLAGQLLREGQKVDLDAARDFLGLKEQDVSSLHVKAFGRKYEESVQEAMGREGVMQPEVQEALVQLRERLGITSAAAEKIFYSVVDARLREMMGQVREAWEEATYTKEALTQIWKERGKDVGDDPSADGTGGDLGFQDSPTLEGIRGFKLMVELTKVANFYLRNKVLKEGKAVKPEEAYPVTVGKYLDDKTKEEIYGIYAWNAITSQDGASRDQWTAAKPHVGGILGLDQGMQMKVLIRMVSRWANMYIKKQIQEKGELGQDDITTLTTWVPSFFGIDKQVTQEMVQTANKGMLQAKVLRLLNKPKVTPEDVQKLREDVATWDLVLRKDLELTKPQLRSLFRVEVTAALEEPSFTLEEKQDAVVSSQESFGLDEREAAQELKDLLRQRCKGCLVNAVGDLMQGNEAQAVENMRRLELLAAFAAEADGVELRHNNWEVAPSMRQKLIQAYASSSLGGGKDGQGSKAPDVMLLERTLDLVA